MQRQFFLGFFLCLLSFAFSAKPALAASAVQLPVRPVSQWVNPSNSGGDNGSADCMAASLTVSLQTLADERQLLISPRVISYASVRSLLRQAVPNLSEGISLDVLSQATIELTGNDYHLVKNQTNSTGWVTLLQNELTAGRPVIVHIPDRAVLYGGKSKEPASHVIVVYGIDDQSVYYADSWDGRLYKSSHNRFAAAWGTGYYNWLAFTFLRQPAPTTFGQIMKYRFLRAG